MKKVFLILLTSLMYSGVAQAQNFKVEGSFDILKTENIINFKADYSNASIMNMNEADFAKYEKDWYKDLPIIISNFTHEVINGTKGRITLGTFPNAKYTMRWEVLAISLKGDTTSNIYIENNEGEILACLTLYAEGGTFGTKLALIKDGAQESGKVFCKFLKKRVF